MTDQTDAVEALAMAHGCVTLGGERITGAEPCDHCRRQLAEIERLHDLGWLTAAGFLSRAEIDGRLARAERERDVYLRLLQDRNTEYDALLAEKIEAEDSLTAEVARRVDEHLAEVERRIDARHRVAPRCDFKHTASIVRAYREEVRRG